MERSLKFLFAGAFALMALVSCDNDEKEEPVNNPTSEYDDSYYAEQAVVTSSDANYTANGNDGTIQFKTEGGQVVVNVSCGCDWVVTNNAEDLFATSITNNTLTITATQNTVESDLTGTIRIQTASWRITFSTITVNQSAYGAPEITVETSEWHAPAVGALTTEIAVDASTDWTATAADSWLTVSKTENGINLTAAENVETTERSTKVTLSCTDGIRTEYDYVTVTQDGAAYINLSSNSIMVSPEGGSVYVTVESNFDWEYSYDTSNGWFTITQDGDTLTATASEYNGSDNREGSVTLTAGDGAENVTEVQLSVVQAGDAAMILTYSFISANTTISLPLSGTVDCMVNWGDGSSETVKSSLPSHTYAKAGEYDVIVSGTVTSLSSSNISSEDKPLPLTAVKQWGSTGLTAMNYAFWYCENLVSLPETTDKALANVSGMYGAFYYCNSLKEIPKDLFGGCTKVTDFQWVFCHCEALSAIPEGLFSDCSAVKYFGYAFRACYSLTTVPSGLFDNSPDVTSFYEVFYECNSLETIPSELFAKNTKATDFKAAFRDCPSLKAIPSKLFGENSGATDLSWCFSNCTSLSSIESDAFHCPKVTDMSLLFTGCSSLKELPNGLFDNCPEVTTFEGAFYEDPALTTIPAGLFDKCLKVQRFSSLFYNCPSLASIPDGLFANCPEATSFNGCFYQCSALTKIPADLFKDCPKATNLGTIFYYDRNITEIPEGLFDGCPEATNLSFVFYNTGIKSIPPNLFEKNTKNQSFDATFYNCTNLTEIPENIFSYCPEVTDFSFVIYGCTGLTSIPAGLFASNPEATNFQGAFVSLKITSIPYDLFANQKKVVNFIDTFSGCSSVTGESPYDEIEGAHVHLYERENYPDIYVNPTSHGYCFRSCTGLSDYSNIPSSWYGASTSSVSTKAVTGTSCTRPAFTFDGPEKP